MNSASPVQSKSTELSASGCHSHSGTAPNVKIRPFQVYPKVSHTCNRPSIRDTCLRWPLDLTSRLRDGTADKLWQWLLLGIPRRYLPRREPPQRVGDSEIFPAAVGRAFTIKFSAGKIYYRSLTRHWNGFPKSLGESLIMGIMYCELLDMR